VGAVLSGFDLEIVALRTDPTCFVCRACAVARIGEHAVQRIEHGLLVSDSLEPVWSSARRHEVDEHALDWGWERPDGCGPDVDGTPCHANAEGFCEVCSEVACDACGKRLDTTPEPL